MADFKNRRRYENLNRLSIEQLEELLRTAPFLSDSQETSEYYDAIEEVILRRETESPTGRLSDIDSAWAEFQQEYASPEGRGQRLYPDEEGSDMTANVERGKTRSIHGIFRKTGLVAAAIAAVLACMVAAQATGLDVFGSLAQWTNETFHFSYNETGPAMETPQAQSENEDYLAIKAEVDQMGITVPVVPTWFPEGYTLQEIIPSAPDIKEFQFIHCVFSNGSDEPPLFLDIKKFVEGYDISSAVFEKDDQPVVQYISNNRLFYIMSDHQYKTAVWSDGNLMIDISGVLTEETTKKIIDSIGGYEP